MKKAAGILCFKKDSLNNTKVLLVHPGGPFWARRDKGVWSIPKGEFTDEEPIEAAKREFEEEIGATIDGNFIDLGSVKMNSGKVIYCFAIEMEFPDKFIPESNTTRIEWPPKSKKWVKIPEVDRAEYFDLETAKEKLVKVQVELIDRLINIQK